MIRLDLWFLPRAFLLHGGHGLRPAPGIPCALFDFGGPRVTHHSGTSCRENMDACLRETSLRATCPPKHSTGEGGSEAIQNLAAAKVWIASALAPRNDGGSRLP